MHEHYGPVVLVVHQNNSERLSSFFERLDRFEYVVNMSWHLEATPFFFQHAIGANQECAAFDTLHFLAVHDLVLDHAKHVTHFFFGVGNQLKRQFEFGLELVVGLHVVAGNTENLGPGFNKVFVLVPELHGLGGATGGVVLGVEVQNHGFPDVGGIGYPDAAGSIGFKFGEWFVDNDRHRVFQSRVLDVSVVVRGVKSDSDLSPQTATSDFTLNWVMPRHQSLVNSLDEERRDHFAAFSCEKVIGAAGCLGVHSLYPNTPPEQAHKPLGWRKLDTGSTPKQHQFRR